MTEEVTQEVKGTENLHDELFRLEPKIDLLHDLLGYGRFAEVYTDGRFFFGRRHGDIGFNELLGQPSEAALQRTRTLLAKMSDENRAKALHTLKRFGISLKYSFQVIE